MSVVAVKSSAGPLSPNAGEDGTEDVLVTLDSLRIGPSPRRGPVRAEHVEALVAARGAWPPILVHRASLVVVDGHHRLAAAAQLGMESIAVTFFDGDEDAAELEAIRRNVSHGLPLTLAERKSAAGWVVKRFPSWSDSRIAEICGLSPKTVGRLRPGQSESATRDLERRVGRDGKRRPACPGAVRERVANLLLTRSGLSLRQVAAEVGASKETVRSVRKQLETGMSPGESKPRATPLRRATTPGVRLPEIAPPAESTVRWSADNACLSTRAGKAFAAWFDAHSVDGLHPLSYVACVPLSRVYDVIDESRRRSEFWAAYAAELELRLR